MFYADYITHGLLSVYLAKIINICSLFLKHIHIKHFEFSYGIDFYYLLVIHFILFIINIVYFILFLSNPDFLDNLSSHYSFVD